MKDFETSVAYLRKEALKYGLIKESDNDDKLIERLARIIRAQDPFDGDAEEAEAAEHTRREAVDAQAKQLPEDESEDESSSDKKPE